MANNADDVTSTQLLLTQAINGVGEAINASPNLPVSTRGAIAGVEVPTAVQSIITQGYDAVGDSGPSVYLRHDTEPTAGDAIQSVDGSWWSRAPLNNGFYQWDTNSGTASKGISLPDVSSSGVPVYTMLNTGGGLVFQTNQFGIDTPRLSIDSSGNLTAGGSINIDPGFLGGGHAINIGGQQIVTYRQAAPAPFNPTVLSEVAAALQSVITSLTTHGLIG